MKRSRSASGSSSSSSSKRAHVDEVPFPGISHGVGRVPRAVVAGAGLGRTEPLRHAAPCVAPIRASREAAAENAQAPPPALPQPLWRPGATQPLGREQQQHRAPAPPADRGSSSSSISAARPPSPQPGPSSRLSPPPPPPPPPPEAAAHRRRPRKSLKPALTAEIPSRDSEIPTKKRPLEDTERNVDEDSSCETPVARRPKPSPEDLLEVEKGDEMKVDVAPTSAQGLTPPRTDSDAAGSDFSRKCDPEHEVTAEITASSAQPIQREPYEEVPSKQPADSEAQRRAEGGNKQASPPRQQNNTTDTTPEPNIDDSQATAVAPFSHRRRLRPTPGLAVTRHQAKATPEKKEIKKKNIKYEVIRANIDEEKENGHSDL
ncbi:mediator of DNA damage checkpoint protein 1-like [Schistocerca cancellata]|uniref:mediator of DNA damage checkpoint protein 1-like n=1 Tax=Schistocerca cancellata TaxID=274614 RepID=UPI0021196E79|nr:mediator of DNA damage checkpoint protein 1-like [Schistocerca cancellata]